MEKARKIRDYLKNKNSCLDFLNKTPMLIVGNKQIMP
jgi:hypothetical protein